MGKTLRDHLVDALEDLEEEQLKKFKRKLNEIPVRAGFDNIPRGRLQKADALDTCDLLISYYTDAYAVQVTAEVLESINLKCQAKKLLSVTGIGNSGSVQTAEQSSHGFSGRNGPQEEPHFIDKHRAELIQRTSTVEGVLDLLHGTILDDEQYERIASRETNQFKMRELYKLVPSWDRSCKDRLYEALKAKNKFLVQDLEGR
ncbi:apoptosis-associated speck-like protein containing a CARD [Eublepharis macularius]|uniref:Apoptosis-associated speck-like protein containing a CARD n=1 Tax=Eublepharis macularius TaxID=481883 RepID=A0AA97LEJ0_EUBMA|nr:apoptosis-associated speck-like protein containing a CARD [Eublepharis macularius]